MYLHSSVRGVWLAIWVIRVNVTCYSIVVSGILLPPSMLIYEVFVLFFILCSVTFAHWSEWIVFFFFFSFPSRSVHSFNHVLVIVMVLLFEMGTSLVSHLKVNVWTVWLSWLIAHLWFLFDVFRICARTLGIASHGVLWGWFEPRYWYLFEYSVDCDGGHGWKVPEPVHVVDHVVLELLNLQNTTLPKINVYASGMKPTVLTSDRTYNTFCKEKYELCKIYYKH